MKIVNNDNNEDGTIEVFVEIPRGSRNKYEYDDDRNAFRLDRVLYSSVHYPILPSIPLSLPRTSAIWHICCKTLPDTDENSDFEKLTSHVVRLVK